MQNNNQTVVGSVIAGLLLVGIGDGGAGEEPERYLPVVSEPTQATDPSRPCEIPIHPEVNLQPRTLCWLSLLRKRCGEQDVCLIDCFANSKHRFRTPDGESGRIGGGCWHICFADQDIEWSEPDGWNECEDAEPLRNVPNEWTYVSDICIHSVCGRYIHGPSGLEVSVVIENTESHDRRCELPGPASKLHGSLYGIPYCRLELADPRKWQVREYLRTHPEMKDQPDPLSNVTGLAPDGATWVWVEFHAPEGVWVLSAYIADDSQRRVVDGLIFDHEGLNIELLGETLPN